MREDSEYRQFSPKMYSVFGLLRAFTSTLGFKTITRSTSMEAINYGKLKSTIEDRYVDAIGVFFAEALGMISEISNMTSYVKVFILSRWPLTPHSKIIASLTIYLDEAMEILRRCSKVRDIVMRTTDNLKKGDLNEMLRVEDKLQGTIYVMRMARADTQEEIGWLEKHLKDLDIENGIDASGTN